MIPSNNEFISGVTHFFAALLSIAGLILLVVFSASFGSVEKTVGFSVFGAGLILLYLASAVYHFISKESPAKRIWRTIDHSMIYVLIASTYTPLMLALPERGIAWAFFGISWGLAVLGIALRIFIQTEKRWLSSAVALFMGWLSVFTVPVLLQSVPWEGILWLAVGGVFYTIGVVFFALEKRFPRTGWFGMHEIFHIFVMAGSGAHFWFMFKYILYI